MESITYIAKKPSDLGLLTSFSPEFWLSEKLAEEFSDGVALTEIADLSRLTVSSFNPADIMLDTGNACSGLLHLKGLTMQSQERSSAKKELPEGSVIISRLRPYLRQVAPIPVGINEMLKSDRMLGSTEFYVLVSAEPGLSISFLVPWLLSEQVQAVFARATTGGHHPRFDEDLLFKLKVPHKLVKHRKQMSNAVDRIVNAHTRSQVEMSALLSGVNT